MAMVRSMNSVHLVGRIGRIFPRAKLPDSKPGPVNISISTTELYRDNKQRTDWHTVILWGAAADFAERYLTVGALVAVEASLRTSIRNNPDGTKSHFVNIDARHLTLLVRSPKDGQAQEPSGEAEEDEEPQDSGTTSPSGDDDSIPF